MGNIFFHGVLRVLLFQNVELSGKFTQHSCEGVLPGWWHGGLEYWANNKAKLGERQEQCAQARQALAIDKLQNPSTWPQRTNRVLHDFWNGQPHTRVVSRILKELREQMRLDNVRVAA